MAHPTTCLDGQPYHIPERRAIHMQAGQVFGQGGSGLQNPWRFKYLKPCGYITLEAEYPDRVGQVNQPWDARNFTYPIDETCGLGLDGRFYDPAP